MRNTQGQNNAMPTQPFMPPQQTQVGVAATDQPIVPAMADQPIIPATTQTTFNPGIKPSGAPVSFSPKSQTNMTGMFGNPVQGSYDRSMGNGFNPPIPTIAPIVPVDNLYNS